MSAAAERFARAFELQADTCAQFGSALYAGLMRAAAADIRAGGPLLGIVADDEREPAASALALRLFGAVHRIVLEGRASDLAQWYPSAGGTADGAAAAWPEFK